MRIELRYDDAAARAALQKAPGVVRARLGEAVETGAALIARAARENVSKRNGFGGLLKSIQHRQLGPLHWEVRPSVAYAVIVELGSGPAAGRAKYYPNPDALRDWLMLNPSYRGHKWARKGSQKRGNQELDIWLRSRAMAWGIYQKGTQPYPFMKPAFESEKGNVSARASAAMRKAVEEINGAR